MTSREKIMNDRWGRPQRGSILIVVLWVVAALSVLAFGFASDMQIGARSLRNAKEGTTGYFLAKAAVNESIFQMSRLLMAGAKPEESAVFKQQRVAHQPLLLTLATGTAQCWVENESGKLDLNAGSPPLLRKLLLQQFELSDVAADSLINQWTQWRKQKRDANGQIQGGPILAVENMLLFEGMKPDFVYGGWRRNREGEPQRRRGLLELATVYSDSPRINLNYAPLEVLQSLPGIDAAEAQAMVTVRAARFFESVEDCQQRVPLQFVEEARNLVTVEESPVFTLVASGRANEAAALRTVRAIVKFRTPDSLGYHILYWKDEEI